jgi:hypothetical protein
MMICMGLAAVIEMATTSPSSLSSSFLQRLPGAVLRHAFLSYVDINTILSLSRTCHHIVNQWVVCLTNIIHHMLCPYGIYYSNVIFRLLFAHICCMPYYDSPNKLLFSM